DLLPLEVSDQWINDIQQNLGELPEAKHRRYISAYDLSAYDVDLLTQSREMAEYFEAVVNNDVLKDFDVKRVAKTAANFIVGELSAVLSKSNTTLEASRIKPPALAGLISLVLDNSISVSTAKNRALDGVWEHGNETIATLSSQIPPNSQVPQYWRQRIEEEK